MIKNICENIADFIAPGLANRRNELERLANTDELTGLGNRRAFDLAEPKAKRDGFAFILFDANNFGQLNKVAGHAAGDEILQRFSDVIANVSHNFKARAFRLGGDEFVVICLHRFAFQIRDQIEKRIIPIARRNFTVSLSGEVGHSIADADTRLQARKAARKLSF